jgi:hypothetical protein
MTAPEAPVDYVRIINGVRLELEVAGNPSYIVVILDAAGEPHSAPMVYATVGPSADHAVRLSKQVDPGERVFIVSRSAAGRRAMFTVLEPRSLKKLHQRLEVIEETFAETDRPI